MTGGTVIGRGDSIGWIIPGGCRARSLDLPNEIASVDFPADRHDLGPNLLDLAPHGILVNRKASIARAWDGCVAQSLLSDHSRSTVRAIIPRPPFDDLPPLRVVVKLHPRSIPLLGHLQATVLLGVSCERVVEAIGSDLSV